jgi:hypothetical protein
MDILTMIQAVPGVGPFLPYVLVVFGICAIIAAQLPPPAHGSAVYGLLYRVVNVLGQNYNQARNAAAGPPPSGTTTTAPPAAVVVLLVAATLPFVLSACSGNSAASDMATLEATLTAAESVATVYVELPLCTGTNAPLCSDSAVTAQIKAADMQAYTLVKTAEQAVDDPSALSAAQAAVTALAVLTATLPTQGN